MDISARTRCDHYFVVQGLEPIGWRSIRAAEPALAAVRDRQLCRLTHVEPSPGTTRIIFPADV
jgi:hypothetical protein